MNNKNYLFYIALLLFITFSSVACSNKNNDTGKKGRQGNTNANIVNGGLIAKKDDWYYYGLSNTLYRSKVDGSKKEKLYFDETGGGFYNINVVDDWVYFRSLGLHRIKTNGKNYERISAEDVRGGTHFIDGLIYYGNEYQMKYDGSKPTKIYDNEVALGHTLNIVDGWYYFLGKDENGDNSILKMKLDGLNKQIIYNGQSNHMVVVDDWIYFENTDENGYLYKMKTDGSKVQLVVESRIMAINVIDGWIYYSGENRLSKIKVDGSDNQVLSDDNAIEISIIDDWIYYKVNGDSTTLYKIKKDGSKRQVFYVDAEEDELENDKSNKLNKTYMSNFSKVNAITYPTFIFDYYDSWKITQEEVTLNTENVTLTNDKGSEIKFSYFGYPEDFNFSTSTTNTIRVDVSNATKSSFIPGYVQAKDYSSLGKFMVAKLKVTGELNMQLDTEFNDIDGTISYAVLPESQVGTRDDVRGPFEGEFSFWYSGYISFYAKSPNGKFSKEEEKQIKTILSSFRIE